MELFSVIVAAVLLVGIAQSTWLLVRKPFANSKHGAWNTIAAELTDSTSRSPTALLFTRTATFVFSLGVLINQLVFGTGVVSFKFFTVWSFAVLIIYFGIATLLSLRRFLTPDETQLKQRRVNRLEYSGIALYHVMLTSVCIVDVITWTVLWPSIKRTTTGAELERLTKLMLCSTSYVQHGFNAMLALVELSLNRMPIHPHLCGWVGFYSIAFACWALLWRRLSGLWLYPFLQFWQAYPGLFVGHWVFFALVLGLDRVKTALMTGKPFERIKTA